MLKILNRNATWLALGLGVSAGAAMACGEPDDVVLAQSYLNISYENATHVVGAVWAAQQAGILPMPDREQFSADRERLAEIVEDAHIAALESQGLMGINLAAMTKDKWNISLVLVKTMHWGRFELDPARPIAQNLIDCSAAYAQTDDLVITTEAVVLRAIVEGNLPVARALDLGVMRIYGSEERRAAFIDQFGTLGTDPLRDVSGVDGFMSRITSLKDFSPPPATAVGQ